VTRAALLVAWHEYITNVRRPGFIFATLLAPLGALVVVALVLGLAWPAMDRLISSDNPAVGVVDPTGRLVPLPDAYAERYRAFADEEAARTALRAGELSGYLVVGPDFPATGEVHAFTRPDLRLQVDGLSPAWLRPLLLHGLLAGRVDAATAALAQSPDLGEVVPAVLDGGSGDTGDPLLAQIVRTLVPFCVATLLAMTIFGASNYLLRSVTEEKENRVLEMLLCALTPLDLLAGKVIGLGALSVTQVAVWPTYGALPLLFGFRSLTGRLAVALDPLMLLLSFVYFLLGYLQYAVLMAAAGALGTNMRESQQIGGQFALFSMIPFFVAPFMIIDPNLPVARFLSVLPLFAPTMMMIRLPFGEVPPIDIAMSLLVSAATIPAVVWASARVFRASLLVYGKRLTAREVVAALRAS
jgi:ABC-2 type transport system permease protein